MNSWHYVFVSLWFIIINSWHYVFVSPWFIIMNSWHYVFVSLWLVIMNSWHYVFVSLLLSRMPMYWPGELFCVTVICHSDLVTLCFCVTVAIQDAYVLTWRVIMILCHYDLNLKVLQAKIKILIIRCIATLIKKIIKKYWDY